MVHRRRACHRARDSRRRAWFLDLLAAPSRTGWILGSTTLKQQLRAAQGLKLRAVFILK